MAKKYSNFPHLLKVGDKGEQRFAEWMLEEEFVDIKHIKEVMEEEGLEEDAWDFRATSSLGLTHTFEVKTQDECHEWGTHNPEQVQNFKEGAVIKSIADYYVVVNKELGFGFIDMQYLKDIHAEIAPKIKSSDDYYKKKKIKTSFGTFQLYATKNDGNPAFGWRHPNDCKRTTWRY